MLMCEITPANMHTLETIVRDVAESELLQRFRCVDQEFKADGSVVTEADRASQRQIQAALFRHWPDIPFLGEEMSLAEQRRICAGNDAFWCLDPLDGTTNYAAGIPYFAVSLALIEKGEARMGIVYDPIQHELFSAVRGEGARLNGRDIQPATVPHSLDQAVGLIDLKRLPAHVVQHLVTSPPYRSQRSFGAGALDWCQIAMGRCHVYLHGKQKLWDYAAGRLILEEAGGHWGYLENQTYTADLLCPGAFFAATDTTLFNEWKKWLTII